MSAPALDSLDLNKLVALEALLRHQSVSAAARELGLTQPTLSQLLAQVRLVFDDPLLVRTGNRMVATSRAAALRGPLADAITSVRRLGQEAVFVPGSAVARLRVACTDFVAGLVMPAVVRRLRAEAPGLHVELQNWGARRAETLATDELDLGIGTGSRPLSGIYQRKLFTDEFVCIADKNNRAAHRNWTPAGFASLPHAQLSVKGVGTGAVDAALAEQGLSRTVAVSLPHFWLAADFILGTDLVLTVPRRLCAALTARSPGLKHVPLPLCVQGFTATLLWHERRHHDPAHRWLRDGIVEAAQRV
ncbi:LysR family transcriptional regulator [Polyangium spumosum]|nr:LysR family transcriptional regulator [Polyangium spumosum]